jgi:RNA polymerase sigma-70 factor (ECF subfamily)
MEDRSEDHEGSALTIDLLREASQGSQAAWTELYARHRAVMRTLVQCRIPARLRSRMETEDVLQSAFISAFQKLESFQYQGEDSLEAWLKEIIRHKLLDRVRYHYAACRDPDREHHQREASETGKIEDLEADESSPLALLEAAERQTGILMDLDKLSEADQVIVIMRHVDHLTYAEIAEELGLTETTARRRCSEALEHLFKRMQ